VPHLDQVQDDLEALRARLREAIHTDRGRGHQLTHLPGRAEIDAGCGEGGRELGMAEQCIPRYGGQEHVEFSGAAPYDKGDDVDAEDLPKPPGRPACRTRDADG
jgi:hypothetical protein